MEFDTDFYQKWKAKSTNNYQFFTEESDLSNKDLLETDKLFSSTALDNQPETESFSLRLSESYIDETQESSSEKSKPKLQNQVILISDSNSSDESIISFGKSKKLKHKSIKYPTKTMHIIESSDDESCKTPVQYTTGKKIGRIESPSNTPLNQIPKNKVVIEESDSEIEQSQLPQIIRDTITESVTLSDRKKKEILQWLFANVDGSKSGSSFSQDSVISGSRKSGLSSGNSSLERLEMNYETPNNRGKFSKPSTAKKHDRKVPKEMEQQHIIDEYFTKTKSQLHIIRNNTPGSKCSNETPSSKYSNKTPVSKCSDKTSGNKLRTNVRRVIISDSDSLCPKTPGKKSSEKISKDVKTGSKKVIPEPIPSSSKVHNSLNFDESGKKNENDSKKLITFGSESSNSKLLTSSNSDLKSLRKIIPESESFESNNHSDMFEKSSDRNSSEIISKEPLLQKQSEILPASNSLITNDEVDNLDDSSKIDKNYKEKQNLVHVKNNNKVNDTIEECADILENLYGIDWRNRAHNLISATEPRKQTTKKFFKEVQTEKKIKIRKPRFDCESEDELSGKENHNIQLKNNKTKKSKNKIRPKNSFINDESTPESSPDCSYHTALMYPTLSQNNQQSSGMASTVRINSKNNVRRVLSICDSESEVENGNGNPSKTNQRKLSFDSSSSKTSEFDPEDIVPPKLVTNTLKIKKSVNFKPIQPKVIQPPEPVMKKSFLASLSKDLPLEDVEFKAMVYRVKYNTMKEELCKVLFKLYNEKVFNNQLPENMPIEWSTRLRGTAGRCYNKQSLKALGKTVRSSRIELSTKVLDSPDRLRDTLIHELCHAATWLINNVSDGHGNFWKAWASKAMKVFPELPSISRCHNYEIQTKYTYKCTHCGYSIGRHSKSLDINRKRCGYCHGKFELLINKITKSGKVQKKSTAQTKEPSGFALYVKENYHIVKQSGAATRHGDVMKLLGQQFSAVKITPKPGDQVRNDEDKPL